MSEGQGELCRFTASIDKFGRVQTAPRALDRSTNSNAHARRLMHRPLTQRFNASTNGSNPRQVGSAVGVLVGQGPNTRVSYLDRGFPQCPQCPSRSSSPTTVASALIFVASVASMTYWGQVPAGASEMKRSQNPAQHPRSRNGVCQANQNLKSQNPGSSVRSCSVEQAVRVPPSKVQSPRSPCPCQGRAEVQDPRSKI